MNTGIVSFQEHRLGLELIGRSVEVAGSKPTDTFDWGCRNQANKGEQQGCEKTDDLHGLHDRKDVWKDDKGVISSG